MTATIGAGIIAIKDTLECAGANVICIMDFLRTDSVGLQRGASGEAVSKVYLHEIGGCTVGPKEEGPGRVSTWW